MEAYDHFLSDVKMLYCKKLEFHSSQTLSSDPWLLNCLLIDHSGS